MRNWNVSVDNHSFDSAGITKDCQEAVCEYVWNGFEAQGTTGTIILEKYLCKQLDKP